MSEIAYTTWEQKVLRMKSLVNQMLEVAPTASRIYLANDVLGMIMASEDGAVVAGGTMTKEQALELVKVWQAVDKFLNAPIETGEIPIIVMSKL